MTFIQAKSSLVTSILVRCPTGTVTGISPLKTNWIHSDLFQIIGSSIFLEAFCIVVTCMLLSTTLLHHTLATPQIIIYKQHNTNPCTIFSCNHAVSMSLNSIFPIKKPILIILSFYNNEEKKGILGKYCVSFMAFLVVYGAIMEVFPLKGFLKYM